MDYWYTYIAYTYKTKSLIKLLVDRNAPVVPAKDILHKNELLDEMIARIKWKPSTKYQQEQGCLNVPKKEVMQI